MYKILIMRKSRFCIFTLSIIFGIVLLSLTGYSVYERGYNDGIADISIVVVRRIAQSSYHTDFESMNSSSDYLLAARQVRVIQKAISSGYTSDFPGIKVDLTFEGLGFTETQLLARLEEVRKREMECATFGCDKMQGPLPRHEM